MLIKGAIIWNMTPEEVIIRIPGSEFIRIMPDPENSKMLRYDKVIEGYKGFLEVEENVWTAIPER